MKTAPNILNPTKFWVTDGTNCGWKNIDVCP
jgi:hypothetical protein